MLRHLKLTLAFVSAATLAAQPRQAPDSPVQIAGTIRGRAARGFEPLLGIPVYLTRLPDDRMDRLAINRLVITDATGQYAFDKLAPGRYQICPHSPRSTFLSPCDWDTKSPVVLAGTTARNQSVTQDFTLESGVILNIAVDDEDGELTKTGRAEGLEVAIQGPRGPVQAMRGAQIYRRQYLTIVVPKQRASQILVKTAAPSQVDTDDQGARRQVPAATGLALAVGQENVREVRFFVRMAGRP